MRAPGRHDRPRAKLTCQTRGDRFERQREAQPDTRQTEEFSERAQHHQPAPFDIAGNAFSARPDIHECFVDND
jgi:hypothetical protein